MNRLMELVALWLKRVLTEPLETLNRWQKAARFAYELGQVGAQQLRRDRAQQMAAALSFRTLFGLLPVLVVATVLVKALGLEQHYLEPLGRLFEFLGLDTIRIVSPTGLGPETTTLGVWLQERVREAERVNVAAIGWLGVAVTLYAAISLMVTIENCFNIIYDASQGRAWSSRVPVYWFVLTMSPLLLISSSYVDGQFQQWMVELQLRGWLSTTVGLLWSISAIWVVMFAVYALFPNTRVQLRPAMAGALMAAVLLEFGKRTMSLYLQNALAISQLYGSLGLVPLFMFWVYLMWLAVLFGLEVSSILQSMRGRQLAEWKERRPDSLIIDPAVVISVMQQIGEGFVMGKATGVDQVAESSGLSPEVVRQMVGDLVEAGLLHRLADADMQVVLSRPPEAIPVSQLLEVAFELADRQPGTRGARDFLERLREFQQQAAGDLHLGRLLNAANSDNLGLALGRLRHR